jgi:hypothetical protein
MVRSINQNKWNELKFELRGKFPQLNLDDLNQADSTVDSLVRQISERSHSDQSEVVHLVRKAIEYIDSKHVI